MTTINDFTLHTIPTHERLTANDVLRPVVATRADGFSVQFPTLAEAEKTLECYADPAYWQPVRVSLCKKS